jgi:hypothetical protein
MKTPTPKDNQINWAYLDILIARHWRTTQEFLTANRISPQRYYSYRRGVTMPVSFLHAIRTAFDSARAPLNINKLLAIITVAPPVARR